MVFSKARAIKRLTNGGMKKRITPEVEKMLDNLDGAEATENCLLRLIHSEPILLVVGKDGKSDCVFEADCI